MSLPWQTSSLFSLFSPLFFSQFYQQFGHTHTTVCVYTLRYWCLVYKCVCVCGLYFFFVIKRHAGDDVTSSPFLFSKKRIKKFMFLSFPQTLGPISPRQHFKSILKFFARECYLSWEPLAGVEIYRSAIIPIALTFKKKSSLFLFSYTQKEGSQIRCCDKIYRHTLDFKKKIEELCCTKKVCSSANSRVAPFLLGKRGG